MDTQNQPGERRVYRQLLPSCERCARPNTQVATRTERFLYVRCLACLHTWSIKKVGAAGWAWTHYTCSR
jgi:translation initiation factor 2 beta subunit (eIF-2beta)/eIF-5